MLAIEARRAFFVVCMLAGDAKRPAETAALVHHRRCGGRRRHQTTAAPHNQDEAQTKPSNFAEAINSWNLNYMNDKDYENSTHLKY